MKSFLSNYRHFGTSLGYPAWLNRNIVIANSISVLFCIINLLLGIIHTITHPGDKSFYISILNALIHLSVPLIHRGGFVNFGRTLITFMLIGGALALTITRKLTSLEAIPMNTFLQSRTGILMFCIIPYAMINFRERKVLILNLLICLLGLMLYDPIHNALGVGFYQLGFNDPDYYYTNVVYFIIFMVLVGATGFFRFEMDRYEKKNEVLIDTLHNRNTLIEEQKEELSSQGEVLKELLKERDKDLSQVTRELINFNHELLQYSYTVSHHLRAPVARILGLLDIYLHHSDEGEKRKLVDLIVESTRELDNITLDLNKIVEARSDSFGVREKVNFNEELKQILPLIEVPVKKYNIRIIEDFAVPEVFSVRQRINHILFILITNAIQYRRQNFKTEIMIRSYMKDNWLVLEVQDNGKGIDLKAHKDNLFKPFKSFHPDASGKGISLYLAKLQAERMHGKIEVRSEPNMGTTFSVFLKDWQVK